MPASGWIEPVTLRSGKRRWRVHWYDPGRRHRSRTFDKRAEAERVQAYVRLRTSGPEIAPPPEVTVGWVGRRARSATARVVLERFSQGCRLPRARSLYAASKATAVCGQAR